uniref:Nucleolar protein 16 n=1 Tax=Romanomermis culicivorax TaxID=13658 RepID=A0A915J7E5_ROMCU
MARSVKRGVKKVRNYRFSKNNEKHKWKQLKRNKQRAPTSAPTELPWDGKKSGKANMAEMGLVYDLNKDIPTSSTSGAKSSADLNKQVPNNDVIETLTAKVNLKKGDCVHSYSFFLLIRKKCIIYKSVVFRMYEVLIFKELEVKANKPVTKTLRLSQPEIRYCIYMLEKHGDNYEAMAKDSKNVHQDTAAQLRRKIETFKGIPVQYNAYLRSKGLLPNGNNSNGNVHQEAMDVNSVFLGRLPDNPGCGSDQKFNAKSNF